MRIGKLLVSLLLLFLVLSVTYFFVRPYFRLPFDEIPVHAAVEESVELTIKLPIQRFFATSASKGYLWAEDAKQLLNLLDSLQLGEMLAWDEWWLMPQDGENNHQLTFTFIGSSPKLGRYWLPETYGPTLPFGEGQIYTYAIGSIQPLYFARYHNLLIIGRFPFQIERALLTAQQQMSAWTDQEQMQSLLPLIQETDNWQCILKHDLENTSSLQQLLGYSTQIQPPVSWEWAYLNIEQVDTMAYASAVLTGAANMQQNATAAAWHFLPPNVEMAFPIKLANKHNSQPLDATVQSWLGDGAWTFRMIQPATDEKVDPRMWILPIGDTTAYAKYQRLTKSDLAIIDRANYQLFELEQWQDAGAFTALSDRKLWQPWSCEIPGALILSVYREDLEQYLDYHLLGATLDQNPSFLQLRQALTLAEAGNWQSYQYWRSEQTATSNILEVLFPEAAWAKDGIFLAQASVQTNGTTLVEAVIQQAPDRTGTVIDWSLALPTVANISLLKVQNEQEEVVGLLAQNTNGQTWAFDLQGHELWQNQLSDKLNEPILEINYSSGVQHWVATSTTDLYIWDNNGTDVANASFKGVLPTAAPTRLVFPAVDQALIAFPTKKNTLVLRYLNGSTPNGWPVEVKETVSESLLHISQEREDLIVAYTSTGHWNVINSQGEMQAKATVKDTMIAEKIGDVYLSWTMDATEPDFLISGHIDGTLSMENLSGEQFKLGLGRGPMDNFVQIACWGDDRPDYVAQRGSLLHLFAYENNTFAERWQFRLPLAPDRIIAASPLGILAVSDSRKKVWLINGEGALMEGFPVAGEGNVFLTGDAQSGYQLITSLDRKLYAYYLLDSKQ